jgi:TolB protein
MLTKLLSVLLVLITFNSFGQSLKDSLDIIQLLEKEGATWRMGDAKGHADCWAVKPNGRVLISTTDGKSLDFPSEMIANAPASMMSGGGFAIHSNHKMSIGSTSAWVVHDEVSIGKDGKETLTKEVRLLEKIKGQWKFIGQSAHMYNPEKPKTDTTSYIQTVDITNGRVETLLITNKHFEAPNWHSDNYLILNSYGKLYTLDVASKNLNLLNTGSAQSNNNDHGISPDRKWLAISNVAHNDTSKKRYKSAIYVLPIGGGEPRRITTEVMSFWHGWSADGKTLAYCGERNGNFDIYTIGINGGQEKRLTTTEGLDDGPDYSPDGKLIYFNSYRSGHMQIWRMNADGSNPEQMTFDENSNWFAHPSPDGKWIAYISYQSDEKQQHLFGKQVKLRLMDVKTKAIKDLTPVFFGGQGTINVPSWSADSKKIAFVSYGVK